MAADGTRTTLEENDEFHSSDLGSFQDHGCNIPKRHARVTVKYNRKELQRRLDVEKWIDESLDRLFKSQVGGCFLRQEEQTALAHVCFTILNLVLPKLSIKTDILTILLLLKRSSKIKQMK